MKFYYVNSIFGNAYGKEMDNRCYNFLIYLEIYGKRVDINLIIINIDMLNMSKKYKIDKIKNVHAL